MSRVGEVPVYERCEDELEASLYNLWRRAKLHLVLPLRLAVPGYHGVTIVLEEDSWICVDERNNDLPLLAWVEFEDKGRDTLHTPVKCKLNYYHYAASRLRLPVLEWLEEELKRRLQEAG